MRQLVLGAVLVGLALSGIRGPVAPAQESAPRFFVEGLGGAVVPTFDVSDVAKSGAAVGSSAGLSAQRSLGGDGRVRLREPQGRGHQFGGHQHPALHGQGGILAHRAAREGLGGHREPRGRRRGFDVDGAPDSFTYFAINAGAKLAYNFNRSFAFVLSPQGDIAFSDEAELGTTNAWVWPVTAGLRFSF